jgi:hypothetical protein
VSAVLKGIDNAKGLQEPSQSCSGWTDVSPWASAIGEKRKESVPQCVDRTGVRTACTAAHSAHYPASRWTILATQ